MSASVILDQKAFAPEIFVQESAHANADVSVGPVLGNTIRSIKNRQDYRLESTALESTSEDRFYEPSETSPLPLTQVDAANLIRALRQLELTATRHAPRIAFKANGRILFLD